tara:strand:- start:717 stop:1280 length:564 start_codon:yes stop_codon:yes gene_type:complete
LIIDDDREIIESIVDGDTAKYEIIVKKYQIRVINLCFRYTKNYSDAEEVAQEAFLKAYRSLESFRFDSKFYSWLHRISINCSLNYINSKEKVKEKETISENTCLIDERRGVGDRPDEYYNLSELSEVIEKTFEGLPEELKLIVKLREIDDLSYDEISNKIGIPIGTVRSRLHRAREILIKIIKNSYE